MKDEKIDFTDEAYRRVVEERSANGEIEVFARQIGHSIWLGPFTRNKFHAKLDWNSCDYKIADEPRPEVKYGGTGLCKHERVESICEICNPQPNRPSEVHHLSREERFRLMYGQPIPPKPNEEELFEAWWKVNGGVATVQMGHTNYVFCKENHRKGWMARAELIK